MSGWDAFILSDIQGKVPDKIESLCSWSEYLILGSTDGMVYLLQGSEAEFEPWTETNSKKISRKPISQVEICGEIPAILTLSDDGVALYGVPEFNPLGIAPNSRTASRLGWNGSKGVLVVAVRRKLIFYKLSGVQLVEMSSLPMPDVALSVAWCGDNVCVGFRKDYHLANPDTGDLKELTSGNTSRDKKPVVTSLPGKEVLVARENVGLFFGADGRKVRREPVSWTESPYAVVVSGPYFVALTPTIVEVRNLNATARKDIVQMLYMEEMKNAAVTTGADGTIYFAPKLKNQISRLKPVALAEQVAALADLNEFDDALQLSTLLPDEERQSVEDVLRARNGIFLFSQGYYDVGLSQFAMRSTRSPLLELMLFPSVTPQWLLKNFRLPVPEEYFNNYKEPDTEEEYLAAINSFLPILLSHRSRLASRQYDDEALEQQSVGHMNPISEEQETEDFEDDQLALPPARKLWNSSTRMVSRAQRSRLAVLVDTVILKAILKTDDTGKLLQFVQQPNFVDLDEGQTSLTAAGRYAELAALYQSHGCNDKGMDLLRLVSQDPDSLQPPPSGAAAAMKGATGVWSAVRYLSKLGKDDTAVIQRHAGWVLQEDPEAALEVFVGAETRLSPSLVLPILEEHAPQYSAVYLEAMLENGDAPLEEFEGSLVDIYLREALMNESKLGPLHKIPGVKEQGLMKTHDRVKSLRQVSSQRVNKSGGDMFFRVLETEPVEGECQGEFASQKPIEAYERLRDLVINSDHINAASVLGLIPQGRLLELRALLMERMGHTEAALEIYILELESLALAEELCDRFYKRWPQGTNGALSEPYGVNKDLQEPGDIYMVLLKIYTRSRDGQSDFQNLSDETWMQVSELLSRKRARINVNGVFELLPDDVTMGLIMPFLEGGIRALAEKQRNNSIVKNLRTCENFEVKEQLILCKQRMVSVTTDRACWVCHKRIGNAVVVAYPNNSLAHYACYLREEQSQS